MAIEPTLTRLTDPTPLTWTSALPSVLHTEGRNQKEHRLRRIHRTSQRRHERSALIRVHEVPRGTTTRLFATCVVARGAGDLVGNGLATPTTTAGRKSIRPCAGSPK